MDALGNRRHAHRAQKALALPPGFLFQRSKKRLARAENKKIAVLFDSEFKKRKRIYDSHTPARPHFRAPIKA